MFDTVYKKFPRVKFLGGSSTLFLGNEAVAREFFSEIANHLYSIEKTYWHCPEVINYRNSEDIYKVGSDEWMRNAERFLESPREIMYQTLGKMICVGGKLVFCTGVTSELVEKFDNQNLTSYKRAQKAKISDEYNEHDFSFFDEYEDEYPELDEFGNPNDISWLREYAFHAEDVSRSQKADLFLNLEWNKPKAEFPRPFWLLFDRIYEIKDANAANVNIIQIK